MDFYSQLDDLETSIKDLASSGISASALVDSATSSAYAAPRSRDGWRKARYVCWGWLGAPVASTLHQPSTAITTPAKVAKPA